MLQKTLRQVLSTAPALLLLLALSCGAEPRAGVVVTTTMLEETARDLLRDAEPPVEVVCIVPPGACPGHFDLSPRSLPAIKNAAVVLLHDYQKSVGDRIREVSGGPSSLLAVPTSGSLLVPENHIAFINRLAETLVRQFPDAAKPIMEAAMALIAEARGLGESYRADVERLAGQRVIASALQAEFCEWLGLDVVGQIERPEDMTPRDLETLLALEPRAVVANLQEGIGAAESLAERLKRPLVVLSNFPGAPDFGQGYEDLFNTNVRRLVDALQSDKVVGTSRKEAVAAE